VTWSAYRAWGPLNHRLPAAEDAPRPTPPPRCSNPGRPHAKTTALRHDAATACPATSSAPCPSTPSSTQLAGPWIPPRSRCCEDQLSLPCTLPSLWLERAGERGNCASFGRARSGGDRGCARDVSEWCGERSADGTDATAGRCDRASMRPRLQQPVPARTGLSANALQPQRWRIEYDQVGGGGLVS
jgi:hypothetical protein